MEHTRDVPISRTPGQMAFEFPLTLPTATMPITMAREDTKRQGIVRDILSGSVVSVEVSMGRKR